MLQIYVSNVSGIIEVCCSCFIWLLQKQMGGCCICCKCFKDMLQEFVQNVSSVTDLRCKRFDCCICFTHMLQHYVSNVLFVPVFLLQQVFSCCKLQVVYLDVAYVFCTHVASVCSRCFICFRRMLHVFHVVWRVRERGRVMVAPHGCRGLGHGEPVAGGCGTRCVRGWRSGHDEVGCACGAGRIEEDGTDCEQVTRTRRQHDAHANRAN